MISIAPLKIKKIHIIGIAGIGMSGIADVLNHLGYQVQGSDLKENANTQRLEKKGIHVLFGHKASNIDSDISVLVHSTAVSPDNPEIQEAVRRGIPVITRAEMLSELMRFYLTVAVSGTHGKTTTTSLIGHVMKDLSPTIINGGIINTSGSNVEIGTGDWMVVEADESDGTFVRVPATVAVVTNIDPEHLNHYGDFESLKGCFKSFVERVAFYGFSVLCYDHPVVRDLALALKDVRIFTYGLHPNAAVRSLNIRETAEGVFFDVALDSERFKEMPSEIKDVFVPLHGKHNVLNTLAALSVGLNMGISPVRLKESLLNYQGVQRRFTDVGTFKGVRFIDDYAHHPTEVKAVLEAARGLTKKKVIGVFQPHRYSRLEALFQEFVSSLSLCDYLFVTPVYAAGEGRQGRVTEETVVEEFKKQQSEKCELVKDQAALAKALQRVASDGDIVLFLGAGDITKWAATVPSLFGE